MIHDIVLHVNNSVQCGLTVRPNTMVFSFAPTFIPRFAMMGERRGIDRARWSSYVQSRFDGGAGQLYWSSAIANNKFADSNYIDIGIPMALLKNQLGVVGNIPNNTGVYEDMDNAIVGDLSTAIAPQATTGIIGQINRIMMTSTVKVHMVEMSGRPHMWQAIGAQVYTNPADAAAWGNDVAAIGRSKLTGKWVTHNTFTGMPHVFRAVQFSSVVVLAMRQLNAYSGESYGLQIYGSYHTAGLTASTHYIPAYSSLAKDVAVYDGRLWRSWLGQVHYLQPTASTVPATWSDDLHAGDPSVSVRHMCDFNGRLYIGKDDALWIFDANRVYKVADFNDDRHASNFGMMVVHRGYMYFNIRHLIYRLSTEGLLELLQSPIDQGTVLDGASHGDNLYALSWTPPGVTQAWIFNAESGGFRRWFWAEEVSKGDFTHPKSIQNCSGLLWLAPVQFSNSYAVSTQTMPVMVADKNTPIRVMPNPNFALSHSWIITSMHDMGLPSLQKLYNAVEVGYELFGPDDRIDVSYIVDTKEVRALAQYGTVCTKSSTVGFFDAAQFSGPNGKANGTSGFYDQFAADDVTKHDAMLIGFKEKCDMLKWWFVAGANSQPFSSDTWTANYLTSSSVSVFDMKQSGIWDDSVEGEWRGKIGTSNIPGESNHCWIYTMKWAMPSTWAKMTRQAAVRVAFDPTYTSSLTDTYYWIFIQKTGSAADPVWMALKMIQGNYIPTKLKNQEWVTLGTIDGATTDIDVSTKRLSFPTNFNSKQIMLRFDMHGSYLTRPTLTKYEIEYMPFPSNLQIARATVVTRDDIALRDMSIPIEHQGATIAATLFSCAGSGLQYVVELPWPTVHTILATVRIAEPGAIVPWIQDKGFSEGDIPIEFSETWHA